jgi:hypothetical protein
MYAVLAESFFKQQFFGARLPKPSFGLVDFVPLIGTAFRFDGWPGLDFCQLEVCICKSTRPTSFQQAAENRWGWRIDNEGQREALDKKPSSYFLLAFA